MRTVFLFLVLFLVGCSDMDFRPIADNSADASMNQADSSVDIAQSVDVSAPQGTDASSAADVQTHPYNWCDDKDGDFYSVCDGTCVIPGNEFCGDCNDNDSEIHPNAKDICDGKDNDCNGKTDDAMFSPGEFSGDIVIPYYQDLDGDGYGNANVSTLRCTAFAMENKNSGWIDVSGDCNDADPSIHPGAKELCDSIDNNCDGQTDEYCSPLNTPSQKGVCSGFVLYVPYNCATIQKAVDTATGSYGIDSSSPLTTIYVAAGGYKENIVTLPGSNIALSAMTNNEVLIDGGMQSAFIAGMSSRLTLQNVTIESQQIITDNPPSTVYGDTGASIVLDDVKLYTHTFGLMVSYSVMTLVQNSLIVGNGPTTLAGLILDYQNDPTKSEMEGAHVYNNVFQDLNVAMAGCNNTKPKLSPMNAVDTNVYTNVNIAFQKGCLNY